MATVQSPPGERHESRGSRKRREHDVSDRCRECTDFVTFCDHHEMCGTCGHSFGCGSQQNGNDLCVGRFDCEDCDPDDERVPATTTPRRRPPEGLGEQSSLQSRLLNLREQLFEFGSMEFSEEEENLPALTLVSRIEQGVKQAYELRDLAYPQWNETENPCLPSRVRIIEAAVSALASAAKKQRTSSSVEQTE